MSDLRVEKERGELLDAGDRFPKEPTRQSPPSVFLPGAPHESSPHDPETEAQGPHPHTKCPGTRRLGRLNWTRRSGQGNALGRPEAVSAGLPPAGGVAPAPGT